MSLAAVFNTITVALGGTPAGTPEAPPAASEAQKQALICEERFAVGESVTNTQRPANNYEVAKPGYMMGDDCFVDLQQKTSTGGNDGFVQRTPSSNVEAKGFWSWF